MPEARIWIMQCLCPQRHAIVAACAVARTEAEAREMLETPFTGSLESLIAKGAVNPWCRICGAPQKSWHYEVGCSRFRTLEEAKPALRQAEALNLQTNAIFGGPPGPGQVN